MPTLKEHSLTGLGIDHFPIGGRVVKPFARKPDRRRTGNAADDGSDRLGQARPDQAASNRHTDHGDEWC